MTVLRQICAVYSIFASVLSKLGSEGVWPEVLRDFGVHGSHKLSELLDGILLSDLHNDAWSGGHLLDHTNELWEDTFVDLEELFGSWFVESKHLH